MAAGNRQWQAIDIYKSVLTAVHQRHHEGAPEIPKGIWAIDKELIYAAPGIVYLVPPLRGGKEQAEEPSGSETLSSLNPFSSKLFRPPTPPPLAKACACHQSA